MKKYLITVKNNILSNKKMIIFFITLTLVGIVAGSLFAIMINSNDKLLVSDYLNSFITGIKDNNINYYNTFINSLINNMFFIILIWLLGFSVIGLPIMIFTFFGKSFSLGFSISSIIINYKLKGILYSLVYIFPSYIIYIISYTILMIYSVTLSLNFLNAIIKKKSIDFKNIINKYIIILFIVILMNILAILFETFIMPFFMKLVLLI